MNLEKKQSRGSWKANKNRESSSCGVGAKTFFFCLEWCVWKAYSGLGDDGAVIPDECVKCCTVFVWHSKQENALALASNNISRASWEVEDLCPVHGTSLSRLQGSLCSNHLMSTGLQAVYENQYLKGRGGKKGKCISKKHLESSMPDKLGVAGRSVYSASPGFTASQTSLSRVTWEKEMFGLSASASRDSPRSLRRPARIASRRRMRRTMCNPLALQKNGSPHYFLLPRRQRVN